MQLHLHAYRKDHEYQDCGPIDPEDAFLAKRLAQQNLERVEESYGGEWCVEIENHGRRIGHVGFNRKFSLEID
jgi:hypothetical protein